MARTPDERWADDRVQFPRLLAEIMATIAMTKKQYKDLCEGMDLEPEQVSDLFDRADRAWEKQKELVRTGKA